MDITAEVAVVSSRLELRARFRSALRSCGLEAHESDPDPAVLSAPTLKVVVVDLTERSGMDLLRATTDSRPDVRVLSIGYPSIPQRVEEATRLGVERFLAEALPETEVCEAVADALDPEPRRAARYEVYVERARESFRRHEIHEAEAIARRAIALDPGRPEAYNLLGVAREATIHRMEALKFYRIALVLDPTYDLARRNAETAAKPPSQRGPAEFE